MIGLPIKLCSDPVKILLPALLFPVIVLGQEIQPFDRLGRGNVTIEAQHKRGGSSSDYDYRTSWGSYSKTVTSTKEIEVTSQAAPKRKAIVNCRVLLSSKEVGPLRTTRRCAELAEGEGMATFFSTSSKQHQPRYVYLEISKKSGDSLVSNVGGVKQAQNAATSLVFATLSDLMALVFYRQYEELLLTDYEAACPSPAVQAALLSKRGYQKVCVWVIT